MFSFEALIILSIIILNIFRYSRESHSVLKEYKLDVLPIMQNCSVLKEMDLCMKLPGCLWCLGDPFSKGEMRVLNEIDINEYYHNATTTQESSPTRSLYAKIVPFYANQIDGTDISVGYCRDGFSADDSCTVFSSSQLSSISCSYYCILFIVFFTVFLF